MTAAGPPAPCGRNADPRAPGRPAVPDGEEPSPGDSAASGIWRSAARSGASETRRTDLAAAPSHVPNRNTGAHGGPPQSILRPVGSPKRQGWLGICRLETLATPAGLEPATCGLGIRRSVRLSYGAGKANRAYSTRTRTAESPSGRGCGGMRRGGVSRASAVHTRQLEPRTPRRRQGQPALRRRLARRQRARHPESGRGPVSPARRDGEPHRGTPTRPVRRWRLGAWQAHRPTPSAVRLYGPCAALRPAPPRPRPCPPRRRRAAPLEPETSGKSGPNTRSARRARRAGRCVRNPD